jgi:uncharacterized protein YxjI
MQYPLQIRFKVLAFAPQVIVTDAQGQMQCFVKQRLFKFRERINVYRDESQNEIIATIEADRVIDWSASYHFADASGQSLGAVKRRGMKSLWRASYEISLPSHPEPVFQIREANPWAKVADSFLGEIPILGVLTAFLFHPRYELRDISTGTLHMQLTKKSSVWGRFFEITAPAPLPESTETTQILSFLMMVLLERQRG